MMYVSIADSLYMSPGIWQTHNKYVLIMIKLCYYFIKVEGYRTDMGDCSMVQVLATQLWELDFRSFELTQMPVDMIVPCSSRIRGWRQRIPRTSLLLRLAILWVLGLTERLHQQMRWKTIRGWFWTTWSLLMHMHTHILPHMCTSPHTNIHMYEHVHHTHMKKEGYRR